ncbi:hypothetical protein BDM02DRAFT_3116828 [Thelephora ganbajun]|uniref:Uncharacterized protein n=1 Tax=Thelephora ganbajun TaxID=370292 RepID=A0ACB6ZDF7_THEGA|nr:hypothetical protein BDM02DRAFT_3116828 [Thelephora ganbajun]
MNLILSHPELTDKQRAKCVNTLAGVLTNRRITRDRSVLEVAATVTGSTFSSQSFRISRPQPEDQNAPQDPAAYPLTPDNVLRQSDQVPPELTNNEPDEIMEDSRASDALPADGTGPSQQPHTRRTITRHGTEVFYGLITPGNSPVKAPGNQSISPVVERDVGMDGTFTGDHDHSSVPSPGSNFGSPTPQETEPQSDVVSALEHEISILRREKAVLLEKEEYVLRKLSRNGQGTISNIETVTDRTVRQRDGLCVENQGLRATIERLKSGIIDLQSKIAHMQDKLDRAEGERIELTQTKRRWIARMWVLAGRVPGELRKKDAEIENMIEKLVGMHAQLAQEQSHLRELQDQLDEERVKRMGAEAELEDSRTAHAQEIKDRDLAGRRLRDQLKQVVNGLDSGAISI